MAGDADPGGAYGDVDPTPPDDDAAGPDDPTAMRPGRVGWNIAMGIDLGLVGVMAVFAVIGAVMASLGRLDAPGEIGAAALWAQDVISAVTMGIVPFAWVVATRAGGWQGALSYLALRRPLAGFGWGLVVYVGMAIALVAVSLTVEQLSPGITENPVVEQLGSVLTWPLVVVTAVVAGVAEEILFRGILQKWVGLWGQAVLFGILHAGYATVLQVVVPFAIGLLFGYLVRRGMSLWAPITAHTLQDILALSAAKVCAEDPGLAICGA